MENKVPSEQTSSSTERVSVCESPGNNCASPIFKPQKQQSLTSSISVACSTIGGREDINAVKGVDFADILDSNSVMLYKVIMMLQCSDCRCYSLRGRLNNPVEA